MEMENNKSKLNGFMLTTINATSDYYLFIIRLQRQNIL